MSTGYVQRRVAVSTDAADAFKPEWQCASHCHSTVNVPNRYAQRRVAVSTDASGTPGGEWQCGQNTQGAWQCRSR